MDERGQFVAELLCGASKAYAAGAVLRQLPSGIEDEHTTGFFGTLTEETETRILYLAEALATARPALFLDHIEWLKAAYHAHDLPIELLSTNLRCLSAELAERLPPDAYRITESYLNEASARTALPAEEPASCIEVGGPHEALVRDYLRAILEGRGSDAIALVLDAASSGVTVEELQRQVLGHAMGELGRMWLVGEINVAEEDLGTSVARELIVRLGDRIVKDEPTGRRVVLSAVSGEQHDIGSRVVADRFEARGWDVFFLGANTPTQDLIHALSKFRADLLALSTKTALQVRATARLIEAVKAALPIPVLVGGEPFDAVRDLWEVIGADAYASGAEEAVYVANGLLAARERSV